MMLGYTAVAKTSGVAEAEGDADHLKFPILLGFDDVIFTDGSRG